MRKILVVDDDEAILEVFDLILKDAGYKVETCAKVSKCVFQKVDKFKPNLIILDLLLSGADGRQICKKLKSDSSNKSIPIIMISAHPDAKISAIEAGANDFLAKPFEMDELLTCIEKYSS